jgi:hypothetical protein
MFEQLPCPEHFDSRSDVNLASFNNGKAWWNEASEFGL